MKNFAAAELLGTRCRLVGVRPQPGNPVVMATHECELTGDAINRLREFRRANDLEKDLRIVLWPQWDEPGVAAINSRAEESVAPPSADHIRERVAALVVAGFRVAGVSMPHQILGEMAMQQGARLALTVVFHAEGGCLTLSHHGHAGSRPAYLRWDPAWCSETAGSGDVLARYEFAAAIAPHMRRLMQVVPGPMPILACGSMLNLRPAMAPFSEEFGRDVDVLDHPWPGMLDAEAGTIPTEPAAWQVARAAAHTAAVANSK